MASSKEIKRAIKEIKKYHNKIIIMHCVSSYPTKLKDTNLVRITKLKSVYKSCLVGLSDHTNDIISSIASVPFKVVAIEKHFKIDDKIKTVDSSFSITPNQLKKLKNNTLDLHRSFNTKLSNVDKINTNLRRSIYAKKNLKKNEKLSSNNIETLRPFIGICASKYFEVLKKKININVKSGQPIFQNMID